MSNHHTQHMQFSGINALFLDVSNSSLKIKPSNNKTTTVYGKGRINPIQRGPELKLNISEPKNNSQVNVISAKDQAVSIVSAAKTSNVNISDKEGNVHSFGNIPDDSEESDTDVEIEVPVGTTVYINKTNVPIIIGDTIIEANVVDKKLFINELNIYVKNVGNIILFLRRILSFLKFSNTTK